MTVEETNGTSNHDEEINTTAPQSKPEVWSMPEPVFRKTSGKLPGGFAQAIEFETVERGAPFHSESNPSDPQIVLTDRPEPKPKSPVLKIAIVIIAILAMVAFITIFLSLLYFWFWRE